MLDLEKEGYVQAVGKAYYGACNRPSFFRVRVKPGGASEANVFKFWLLAKRLKIPLDDLMKEAIELYGVSWCEQEFNQKHPPLYIVTSPACRKRLSKNHMPKVRVSDADLTKQAVAMADALVGTMGRAKAEKIVRGGWPEDHKLWMKVKEVLFGHA